MCVIVTKTIDSSGNERDEGYSHIHWFFEYSHSFSTDTLTDSSKEMRMKRDEKEWWAK